MIGDALVVAMLEELVADFSIFPSAWSPRTGLYALFSRFHASALDRVPTWNLAGGGQSGDTDAMFLSPVRRQALLLVAVEGFDMVEAAETLAMSEEEFAEHLTSAYADDVIQTSYESEISMCTLANATTVAADRVPDQLVVHSELAIPAFA
ncbi:hypothetical protein EOB36_03665 [Mesorhizobium sp. M6A.T.Cr.TU.017.01.1.1]|uniref:hypothetical protein n=1 Tax=Mesorhizobium sp. M6A.T.Cr.TU.017.01.1.1 TaxID=2496774 RepID=UPI000FD39360|nr:hypothetical protein [Mesorhizobium sp. M6A.T.Cr.TU.017.01.1.1]RUV04139.1 hypothetical protein EOB36_03665 [Mesorhizobium sp. M6A.T.Cr.TU.017.01.1.1]